MQKKLIGLFALILAFLVVSALFSHRATRQLVNNTGEVTHTHNVLLKLEDTLSLVKDAETGQRGYLFTGKDEYLEPYRSARAKLMTSLQELQTLTGESPVQRRYLIRLTGAIQGKLDELQGTIDLRRQNRTAEAQAVVLTGKGKALMDEVRAIIGAMTEEEGRIRRIGLAASQSSARQLFWINALTTVAALAMLLLFYGQVQRGIAERTELLEHERMAREAAETSAREAERMRGEAEGANRLKDEFLATVSHELRTPLTAILGWASILRDENLQGTMAQGIATIERNARSQAQLVEDLLDVSRIISGKLRLEVQPCNLAQILGAALESVRPSADARGIRLTEVLDSDAGPVSGDPERLQQVVWNLLSNAIKFTPKGGRVEVRLLRINSHVEIIVSDSGQGIEPEFLPYVFERFRQADGSTTRQKGGLGLGLSIVRHLVEMHGGSIFAASEGAGQGASFTVILPLSPILRATPSLDGASERVHPQARGSALELPAALPSLGGLRVLAIDDQPDTLQMIRVVLERCGAQVETCLTAQNALEMVPQWRPDIIISDIGMPQADGYSFIRQLRAISPAQGGATPAIALTAFARVEDRVRVLSSGFQMHLAKPVEPAELATIVASLAGRSLRPGSDNAPL